MVEEVAPETNAVQTPREPDATPAPAQPASAAPAEAQTPQKSTTSPQSRKQTTSAPAPAAAPAEPGKKETPQASAMPGGMQGGGPQGIMQMIFMMIAQLFGINITAMQQAQANPNKPALTATAPAGAGLKPTSNGPGLNPNAPAAPGLKVPGATPTPSQSQVRKVDNEIDAAAKPATPPKPDTGIQLTTGVPLEKDEDHRARLGMTQKQYDGLKAEETQWQADARADGAIGDSPFVRADRQDAMAQEKLGLDAIQWQVLKYENKDWQTKIDAGDKTLPKVGPMQQAFMDAEKKTALAVAPSAPAAASAAQPQIHIAPGQETPGIQPRSDGVIPTLVVDGEDPAVSRLKREYAAAPASQPIALKSEYNRAGTQTLPPMQERLQARADRITEYTDTGMTLRDASRQVSLERRQELAAQGLDRNTINTVAGGEEGIERGRISQIEQQQRTMERAQQRQQQQEMIAGSRQAAAEGRASRDLSRNVERGTRILSDGNSRNDYQAGAAAVGVAAQRMGVNGRDVEGIARVMMDGNNRNDHVAYGKMAGMAVGTVISGIGKLFSGGEVITYPQQDRSRMPQTTTPSGRWDSNQISPAQKFSAAYGSTPEERQQLLANQAAQPAMADNSPAALNTDPIRRMPTNNGP